MEKEFISYESSIAMKQLGFDEPCFGYYVGLGDNKEDPFKLVQIQSGKGQFEWIDNVYHAPTFSQCFRWFREEYELFTQPNRTVDTPGVWYYFSIATKRTYVCEGSFSYEKAELACLNKLIEIVNDNLVKFEDHFMKDGTPSKQ